MKENKGFTMIELIVVITIVAIIGILSFMAVTKTIKNKEIEQKEIFNDNLIRAAEIYISSNKDLFPNFDSTGDVELISASELIESGYLDKNIDNPTGKDIINFYVKVIMNDDKTISYEVSG